MVLETVEGDKEDILGHNVTLTNKSVLLPSMDSSGFARRGGGRGDSGRGRGNSGRGGRSNGGQGSGRAASNFSIRDTDGITKLRAVNGKYDLLETEKDLKTWIGMKYPIMKTLLMTGELPSLELPVPDPDLVPGSLAEKLFMEEYKEVRSKIKEMRDSFVPIYTKMESLCDQNLISRVKSDDDYAVTNMEQNPRYLWIIIREKTAIGLIDDPDDIIDNLRDEWTNWRMNDPNCHLSLFKERTDHLLGRMRGMEVIYGEREIALHFIKGLHHSRFETFIMDILNKASGDRPQNLQEAFYAAQTWEENNRRYGTGRRGKMVLVPERDYAAFAANVTKDKNKNSNPPKPTNVAKEEGESGADADNDALSWVQCYKCKGYGHYKKDCPTNKKKVLAVSCFAAFASNISQEIILDGAANVSVFKSENLLNDVTSVDAVNVTGIANGAVLKLNRMGNFGPYSIKVFLSKDASVNILSESDILPYCDKFELEGWGVRMIDKRTKAVLDFVIRDGMKILNVNKHTQISNDMFREKFTSQIDTKLKSIMVTVRENENNLTARQLTMARRAKEIIVNSGGIGISTLKQMALRGRFNKMGLTKRDLDLALETYGIPNNYLKGKAHDMKQEIVRPMLESHSRRTVKIFVDILFLYNMPFLIVATEPLEMGFVRCLENREASTVLNAILSVVDVLRKYNVSVIEMEYDPESGVEIAASMLSFVTYACAVGGHVVKVERLIQQVKEICRTTVSGLAFRLAKNLVKWLAVYAMVRRNHTPTVNLVGDLLPVENLTGMMVDFQKQLALGFGDYCQIYNPNVNKSSMDERTMGAIALFPANDQRSSWWFLCLKTWKKVKRSSWTKLPTSDVVIDLLNRKADAIGEAVDESELAVSKNVDHDKPPTDVVSELPGEDLNEVRVEPSEVTDNEQLNDVTSGDAAVLHNEPVEVRGAVEPLHVAKNTHQMVTRSKVVYMSQVVKASGGKVTVRKALKLYKQKAIDSMYEELYQLNDKNTWEPIKWSSLSVQQLKKVIRSFMFLTEKYDSEGNFDKLKARLVAMGSQQAIEDIKMETNAPTPANMSIFTVASIAAMKKYKVMTADIGGAFVRASLPEDQVVHVLLDRESAAILVQIDDSYAEFVRKDGTMVVKLNKALYGLVQAARLWYDELSKLLNANGYLVNPVDVCVWYKKMEDELSVIVFHVDDLMVVGPTDASLNDIEDILRNAFKDVKVKRGLRHNYLGMLFDFTEPGYVSVCMTAYIERMLEDFEIEGKVSTPAARCLFEVNGDCMKLNNDDRVKFHSMVQRILYLSKRTRWDLLTAVSFLTGRVREPDEDDMKKLIRVLKYLNGTKNLSLRLGCNNPFVVIASIDASHAVHDKGRSHGGMSLSLGVGAVESSSKKLKLNTKSSTESEIVSLSDNASPALGLRNFLVGFGFNVGPLVIEQDNEACILMMKRGRSESANTKHINVRYFFLKDRIDKNEVELKYVPTENMVSDILTKPLQGALFLRLRNILLGHASDDAD